ncbi:MAG TPA: hypothetical protein VHS30_17200, partial [Streptosporangiaceae bacterium]|nr:hypothetical protein [Streptosporangiaceae bacterium]
TTSAFLSMARIWLMKLCSVRAWPARWTAELWAGNWNRPSWLWSPSLAAVSVRPLCAWTPPWAPAPGRLWAHSAVLRGDPHHQGS